MILDRLSRLYYAFKYLPLRLGRFRAPMEHRGFVGVQVDGLSYDDLVYAIERGYLRRVRRRLRTHEWKLHPFPSGLPSCTSYAQVGMFYGENKDIPAFRWYERADRRVINCNRPRSVEYIRRRLGPRTGILRGGSSYVNLIDGDADRAVLTANSSVPRSFFEEIGVFRLVLLALLHPVRIARTLLASILEIVLELYDRYLTRRGKRDTVLEGWFPVIRALSNVILREFQTLAVMTDVYSGVPYIFTTYASYDELAHHYGPRSRPAMKNLKGIFNRILEVERMARRLPGRHYDIIILSDHGQTEGTPFLRLFGATLGETLHRQLEGRAVRVAGGLTALPSARTRALVATSFQRRAEQRSFIARPVLRSLAALLHRMASVESYLPEKYFVDEENEVVVTYSGTLALVYFSRYPERLADEAVRREFPDVLQFLVAHPGIGLVITKARDIGYFLRSRRGLARLREGKVTIVEGENPLTPYEDGSLSREALERMASFENTGDIILFGAYEGGRIVCFDDQVASHGCMGGAQTRAFLLVPNYPRFARLRITDPRGLYDQVFMPYHHELAPAAPSASPPS